MHDFLAEFFGWLLEFVGLATEGASERIQTAVFFAGCALFTAIAGFFFSGIPAMVFFVIAGICALLALLAALGAFA